MTDDEDKILLKQVVNKHLAKCRRLYKTCGDDTKEILQKEEIWCTQGYLRLQCGPYWRFVLEDNSYTLPCIVSNRASDVCKLIDANGCLVQITNGHIIIECYKNGSQLLQLFISVQFSPSQIIVLQRKSSMSWVLPFHNVRTIRVIHTTSPIITENCYAFCLLLAVVDDDKDMEAKYLWILLKDKQVLWHNFLIPNRRYDLHMVEPRNYFERAVKPLRVLLAGVKGVSVFREILHHPELWPTLMAVEMPNMSSIKISHSRDVNAYPCAFPSAWWLSINEAIVIDKSPIVSLWGEVVRVIHRETEFRGGCSLCVKTVRNVHRARTFGAQSEECSWTNPWETGFKSDGFVELPDVYEYPDMPSGEFIPGKLTKMVILRDTVVGNTVSLYIKNRSFHQYCSVFIAGTTLCAKFLQKRASAKGQVYFVSTALSSFELLHSSTLNRDSEFSFAECGFPYKIVEPDKMLWGLLDMWTLVTVHLTYKKINCNNFSAHVKSSKNVDKFTATAVVKVNRHTGSDVCVLMKDHQVKEFLKIPDSIWHNFVIACRVVTLSYDYRDKAPYEQSSISGMFSAFCSMRNSIKTPFHISCKLLPRIPIVELLVHCLPVGVYIKTVEQTDLIPRQNTMTYISAPVLEKQIRDDISAFQDVIKRIHHLC